MFAVGLCLMLIGLGVSFYGHKYIDDKPELQRMFTWSIKFGVILMVMSLLIWAWNHLP